MAQFFAGQRPLPHDSRFDSTLALKRDPYRFIAKGCRRVGDDVFETRILLRRTICMSGPEAAELFYDVERFKRQGAAPLRLQATLFGKGGVQALDDERHYHRKRMFLGLMTPERIRRLGELSDEWWRIYAQRWEKAGKVELYRQAREVLCRAVFAWAGVPLAESDVDLRTTELTALFDSAGAVGPRHWHGLLARKRAERWAAGLIDQIRDGVLDVPEQTAVRVIALHRDLEDRLLDRHDAAVELLNVLRPTVAVAVFVVFEALALHDYPRWRERLREGGADGDVESFVQEVRRFYPFFPAVVARVRHDFDWKGYRFRAGTRVMLDLYGTDHDARAWEAPDEFRPERFGPRAENAFTLVPQGGGSHVFNHRCAGEWVTLELMKRAARFLASAIDYEVPEQDQSVDYASLPALPRSRFVMSGVRLRA